MTRCVDCGENGPQTEYYRNEVTGEIKCIDCIMEGWEYIEED